MTVFSNQGVFPSQNYPIKSEIKGLIKRTVLREICKKNAMPVGKVQFLQKITLILIERMWVKSNFEITHLSHISTKNIKQVPPALAGPVVSLVGTFCATCLTTSYTC